MWSDRYYYLNIYKDNLLSEEVSTAELLDFISDIPELEKSRKFEFKNKESFPFTQLSLLKAKSLGSWSSDDANPDKTNLIAIVSSKGSHNDFEELKRVFIEIASFLQWTLVNEETDDGIENHIIWKPKESKTDV